MCEVLAVSTSRYYAWRGLGLSDHDRRDVELSNMTRDIHKDSHGSYGSPVFLRVCQTAESGRAKTE
jgi:hypothetical protein